MQVKEVMTRTYVEVEADDTVCRASEKMGLSGLSALPVKDGGEIIGMVTDRDIVMNAFAQEIGCSDKTVREIMTSGMIACYESDDLEHAAEIMLESDVRRILVMEGNGTVVGVVTMGDLAFELMKSSSKDVIRKSSES